MKTKISHRRLQSASVDAKLLGLLISSVKEYAIFMIDPEGFILTWNKGAQNIKGYCGKEVIGKHISIFYTPEEIKANEPAENLQEALALGSFEREGWRVRKDGSMFWANIVFTPLFGDEGQLLGFAKVTRDMTEQKMIADQKERQTIELELRVKENTETIIKNETRYRALIENSYDGTSLLDENLKSIYRSRSTERINGWGNEKHDRYNVAELVHPDDLVQVQQLFTRVLNQPGIPIRFTYRCKHKKGHYIWLESVNTNMLGDEAINAIVCNFRDITDKKIAEEELRVTVRELSDYKYALDQAALVAITDQNGIITYANPLFCKQSKYSAEELIGQDHRIVNSGYHPKSFMKDFWNTIESGNIWKGEFKNRTKDGIEYWVDATIIPFLDDKGKPYQYLAIRTDITERKLSQEKIAESEHLIKTVTDNLPAMVAYWSSDLVCLFANKMTLDFLGKRPDEMIGSSGRWLLDKQVPGAEIMAAHIEKVLNGEEQIFEYVAPIRPGVTKFFKLHYVPDMQNGVVNGYYSFTYDITDLKEAEQLVKSKTAQIENILESITDGFMSLDKNLCFIYVNKRFGEMSRLLPGDIVGKYVWDVFTSADAGAQKVYDRALREQCYITFEDYYAPLDLWVDEHLYPSPGGLSVFVRDITERKKAEQLIKSKNEQIENILESITDGFMAMDNNLRFTYVNKRFGEMTTFSPEDLIGKYIWDMFPVGSVKVQEGFDLALREQRNMTFEDYYEPLDLWAEDRLYPSAGGLSVFVRDITERKKAEQLIKSKNEQIEDILERIADGFVALDNNLRYTYVNKKIGEMAGLAPADMIGKYIWDVFPDAVGTPAQEAFSLALEEQRYICFEDNYAPLDIWVEEHLYPSEGGLSVFARDISVRKKAEREIHLLNESLERKVIERTQQLEAANKELEAFSYSVSHDLRTPLRAVSGFATMLKDGFDTMQAADRNRIVNTIVNNAILMGRLIDDLLEFSRLGRKELRSGNVNVRSMVNDCISELTFDSPKTCKFKLPELPDCDGDTSMIKQVWMNLLGNAMKYSSKIDKPVIEVGGKADGSGVTYFVKDNGVGFDMKYAGKLFGVFQRLHRKDEFEGTGVGLALVKRIIDRHQGKLWAEAKPGKGAVFYFSLPVKQAN